MSGCDKWLLYQLKYLVWIGDRCWSSQRSFSRRLPALSGLIGSWRPWAYPAWTFGAYRQDTVCLFSYWSQVPIFFRGVPFSWLLIQVLTSSPRSSSGGLMCNHRSPQIIGMCRSPWTALPALDEMQRVLDVSSRSKGFSMSLTANVEATHRESSDKQQHEASWT